MPAEASDPLRRSKRNKFHLDIVSIQSGGRRSAQGNRGNEHRETPSTSPQPPALSPHNDEREEDEESNDDEMEENSVEIRRGVRLRKIPERIASCYVQEPASDEEEDLSGILNGTYECDKCPMRFHNKCGKGNHAKLHTAADRPHECNKCDFSCGSTKAMRSHKKAHEIYPDWKKSEPSNASHSSPSIRPTPILSYPETPLSAPKTTVAASSASLIGVQGPSSIGIAQSTVTPTGSLIGKNSEPIRPGFPNPLANANLLYAQHAGRYKKSVPSFSPSSGGNSELRLLPKSTLVPLYEFKGQAAQSIQTHVVMINGKKQTPVAIMQGGQFKCLTTASSPSPFNLAALKGASIGAALKSQLSLQKANSMSVPQYHAEAAVAVQPVVVQKPKATGQRERKLRHKCTECPFSTHLQRRLTDHMKGHERESGYKCPHCSYKSESSGFLKRHVVQHRDEVFVWPPIYVVGTKASSTSPSESPSTPPRLTLEKTVNERERGERRGDAQDLILPKKAVWDMKERMMICPLSKCGFRTRFTNSLIAHKRLHHAMQFYIMDGYPCLHCGLRLPTLGAKRVHMIKRHQTVRRKRNVIKYYMAELMREPIDKIFDVTSCDELNSTMDSVTKQEVINIDEHEKSIDTQEKITIKIKEEIMDESERAGSSSCVTPVKQETDSPSEGGSASLSRGLESGEMQCPHCPYIAVNKSRMQRHENKHIIKSEHKCEHCTFSCRGEELLYQHRRLHDYVVGNVIGGATEDRSSAEHHNTVPGTVSGGGSGLKRSESLPVLSQLVQKKEGGGGSGDEGSVGREKETVMREKTDLRFTGKDGIRRERCPECPYTTKHFCDMKAHRAMHGEGKRKYACQYCSYSTKRFMSLKTHLELHGKKAKKVKNRPISHSFYGKIGIRKGVVTKREYMCTLCPHKCTTVSQLWSHSRYHLLEPTIGHHCTKCSFSTVSEERMVAHSALHEECDPMHEVTVAEVMSTGVKQEDVDEEMMMDTKLVVPRTEEGKFRCKECPFTADTYNRAWNHMQKHKRDGKMKCKRCSYSTGNISSLLEHMVVHSAVPPSPSSPSVKGCERGLEGMPTLTPTITGVQRLKGGMEKITNGSNTSSSASRSPIMDEGDEDVDRNVAAPSAPSCSLPFPDPARMARLHFPTLPLRLRGLKRRHSDASVASSDTSSSSLVTFRCTDPNCPYEDTDVTLFELHLQMHAAGKRRPFDCKLCTYSCLSAESLLHHIELHMPEGTETRRVVHSSSRRLSRQSIEVIPDGTPFLQCDQCSFKTAGADRYKAHRLEHAQSYANRLITQIKRTTQNGDDEWKKPKIDRRPLRSDNDHFCSFCGFHCKSLLTFERHTELHGSNERFTCTLCNYSSDTHNVVLYHEMNHHLDLPLSHYVKGAIMGVEHNKLPVVSTIADRIRLAGREVKCNQCDWRGCEFAAFSTHFSEMHAVTAEDKQAALDMSMGLMPESCGGSAEDVQKFTMFDYVC